MRLISVSLHEFWLGDALLRSKSDANSAMEAIGNHLGHVILRLLDYFVELGLDL